MKFEVRTLSAPPPPKEYVITLSEREASVLLEVAIHVGGNPKGPRGVICDIAQRLRMAGAQRLCNSVDADDGVYILPDTWP